jgi:hypothetical protein
MERRDADRHPAFCSLTGPDGLGLGRGRLCRSQDEGLETGVQAALVTGDGVLVQDALLDALVESGDGGLELGLGCGDITLDEGFAHEAQAAANAGTVGAVHFSLNDGLTGALKRRNMICHGVLLILLWSRSPGNLDPRPVTKDLGVECGGMHTHPSQFPSLREGWVRVNSL